MQADTACMNIFAPLEGRKSHCVCMFTENGSKCGCGWACTRLIHLFLSLLFICGGPPHPAMCFGAKCNPKHWLSQGNCGKDGCWLHYLALQVTGISKYGRMGLPRVMGIPSLSVAANVYSSLRDKGGSQGFGTLRSQRVGCADE